MSLDIGDIIHGNSSAFLSRVFFDTSYRIYEIVGGGVWGVCVCLSYVVTEDGPNA